jgi:hypothetical protein
MRWLFVTASLALIAASPALAVQAKPAQCGSCQALWPGGSAHLFKIVPSSKGPLSAGRFETYVIRDGKCCLAHQAPWPAKATLQGVDLFNRTVYATYPDGLRGNKMTHALIGYDLTAGGMHSVLVRAQKIWPCQTRFRWAALGRFSAKEKSAQLVVLDVSSEGRSRKLEIAKSAGKRRAINVSSIRWTAGCDALAYRVGKAKKELLYKVPAPRKTVAVVATERVVIVGVLAKGGGLDSSNKKLFPATLTLKVESVLPLDSEFGQGLTQLSFKISREFYKNIGIAKFSDGSPVQVVLEGIPGTSAGSYQLRSIKHR